MQVTIETVFVVVDSAAEADITDWASTMSETRHSRRKRQNFDDAETEDVVVSSCDAGQGVSSDGKSCGEFWVNYGAEIAIIWWILFFVRRK